MKYIFGGLVMLLAGFLLGLALYKPQEVIKYVDRECPPIQFDIGKICGNFCNK